VPPASWGCSVISSARAGVTGSITGTISTDRRSAFWASWPMDSGGGLPGRSGGAPVHARFRRFRSSSRRNGAATIGACVRSLLDTDAPAGRREIIVVDNGSTDGQRRSSSARRCGTPRAAARRRLGPQRRHSGSQWRRRRFTDADCVVSRGWLQALGQAFVAGAAGVAGKSSATAPRPRSGTRRGSGTWPSEVPRPADAAVRRVREPGVPADVFDRVGLLDEAMTAGESRNSARASGGDGLRARLCAASRVFHRHRPTAGRCSASSGTTGAVTRCSIKYRDEIPWGFRQSRLAYLISGAPPSPWRRRGALGRGRSQREELAFRALDCVKKLAERLGSPARPWPVATRTCEAWRADRICLWSRWSSGRARGGQLEGVPGVHRAGHYPPRIARSSSCTPAGRWERRAGEPLPGPARRRASRRDVRRPERRAWASRGRDRRLHRPDCVASDGWLLALVQGFQDEGVAGGGAIVPYPGRRSPKRYAAAARRTARRDR
jgi:hypothetical protein